MMASYSQISLNTCMQPGKPTPKLYALLTLRQRGNRALMPPPPPQKGQLRNAPALAESQP